MSQELSFLTNNTVDVSNRARRDQLPYLDAEGEVPRPDRLHEEQLLLFRRGHKLAGLRGIDGQRLLAQHVLAGFERQHGVLEVMAVRRGYVDDLHIRVGHQLVIRAVRLGVAAGLDLGKKLGRPVLGRAGGGSDDLVTDIVDVARRGVGDEILGECYQFGSALLPGT